MFGTLPLELDFDRPRNLVVMVADGFGPAQLTLARLASPDGKLLLDELLVGKVTTASTDSLVTDSAAGATAYSCGEKTFNGAVAVKPDGKACATLLEAAKSAGMRTGLVVTSELTHATPAAFSSHSVSRLDYALIGRQLLEANVDVAFGGGVNIFKQFGMWDYALSHFNVITEKAQLAWTNLTRPLLGVFADSHLSYVIDKGPEPSLAEMTEAALPLLKNSKGFFLMVEGSRIDHACHDNDAAAAVQEVLAFDAAVRKVVNFAEENDNTLVVIVADHETGGLSIGNGQYRYNISELHGIHASVARVASKVSKPYSAQNVIAAVKNMTTIFRDGLDESYFPSGINANTTSTAIRAYIANYFSKRTQTGWTTPAHTGVDVNLFAYGMGVTNFVGGIRSNDAIGAKLAEIMKFDLAKLTKTLAGVATSSSKRERVTVVGDDYHY